jgi:hypothetical protein
MTKMCTKCNQIKHNTEFRKQSARKDGLTYWCRSCFKQFQSEGYKNRYKFKQTKREIARRKNNSKFVNELKTKCVICGEVETCCLDFHHKDPSEKDFTISTSHHRSQKVLLEEIAKCICVCSNCHRKIHAGVISLEYVSDR